ncbi:hypothetical protein PROFUN_03061 [Planoprotostelium fungivorum]|uniref:Acyltransferase n=1 Tax=Planoprotostelium fungivorum TaxID=1890364 RepID=A0A2P6NQ39_9EUKA|nr:hypothetical protein PROFUN_03061 [Planoprotostelium fungivorum]
MKTPIGSSTIDHNVDHTTDSMERIKNFVEQIPIYNPLSDLSKAYRNPLATFAVAFWMALMPLSVLGQLLVWFNPFLWPYWLWINMDSAPVKGGRVLPWVRNWTIWKYFKSYFPVNIVKEVDLPSDTNYLFAAHPHGILPLGLWCNFATEANHISEEFPGINFSLCTLESNFTIPFLRDLMLSLGILPVSEESIRYVLEKTGVHGREKGKASAIIDVVGGSAESLDVQPGRARLTLKKRTGFARIAIETGSDLVPVFTFGENEMFYQVDNPRGSWLRFIQETLKTLIGMSPTLFWGVSIKGPDWGFLPMQVPLTSVVGRPIKVQKMEKATDEAIENLKAQYIRELKALYDRHKDTYAKDRKEELDIVQ